MYFLGIFARLRSATLALNARVGSLSCGISVIYCGATRSIREHLMLGGWSSPDSILLLLIPYGLLEKHILEFLVLLLYFLHITSHRLDNFLILSDSFLEHVSLKLLLVQLTLRSKQLFLRILVLFLEKGDELALILLLYGSSRLK